MKKRTGIIIFSVCFVMAISGCQRNTTQQPKEASEETRNTEKPIDEEPKSLIQEDGTCIVERFYTPDGYARESYEADSFAYFVQHYPLYEYGRNVYLYDGNEKKRQDCHVSVFQMDVVSGDLQQCADSVIRMYAEYLYQNSQYSKMQFHFVSGFNCDFSTWVKGNRVKVEGSDCIWYSAGGYDDSKESFEKYLRVVFSYASTLSMQRESSRIELEELEIGDIFIKGGSPGHVVMVVDVCTNENGEKAFLLAQGYMPAQEFHILKNMAHEDDPWYYENEMEYPFETPEYDFEEGSLMRPDYLQP